MKVGNDKKQLFDYLKEIEENTSIDSVLSNGDKICLTLHRGKQGITWACEETINAEIKLGKGNKIVEFYNAIEENNKEVELDYMDVMCLKSSSPTKTWEGRIKCEFFQIDPFKPYNIEQDGRLYIPIVEMELTDQEYKTILETKLALYDDQTLYPIRNIATPSVGAFMDARGLFKKTEDIPLGQAIMLAEKISEHDKFSVITRNVSKIVHPIIGMTAYREKNIPTQREYFSKCLDYAAGQGIYTIGNWKITDDITQLDIYPLLINRIPSYKPVIRIMTSDIPGTGWALKAYASIGPGMVEITNNVIRHSGVLNMDVLFKDVYENFEKFDDLLSKKIKYSLTPSDLKGIKKVIGKKRAKKHDYFKENKKGDQVLYDLSNEIISNTYEKLPTEQMAGNLSREYYNLITTLSLKSHE